MKQNKWIEQVSHTGEMKCTKELNMSFYYPVYRPGQEVEALWNNGWHHARIIRVNNDGTYKLRFKAGELDAEGRMRKLLVMGDGVREIRRPHHTILEVEIGQFKNLGLDMKGSTITNVDDTGYASRLRITRGCTFIKFKILQKFKVK